MPFVCKCGKQGVYKPKKEIGKNKAKGHLLTTALIVLKSFQSYMLRTYKK